MATREHAMTAERLDAFLAAWNDRDVDAIMSYFTEECVFHASVGLELTGTTYRGRAEVRAGIEAFLARNPRGRFDDASSWVAGDRGAADWTFVTSGPDGAEVATRGCDLFEFDGDLIRVKDAFRKSRP
ncbi:MAG: nuclear transport factor 2 family protein [Thermoleophilia bacterium]|nr:nuclear transport factor 2 family protein [Thermoleophilia bacterium]